MKEKGIDQYLDAAKYIKEKYPHTNFHILGFCEGDYEEKLKKMQENGFIQYHGMQNDIREFHKFSHCTIHPNCLMFYLKVQLVVDLLLQPIEVVVRRLLMMELVVTLLNSRIVQI